MSSPYLCVFGDDHVIVTWEQRLMQVSMWMRRDKVRNHYGDFTGFYLEVYGLSVLIS